MSTRAGERPKFHVDFPDRGVETVFREDAGTGGFTEAAVPERGTALTVLLAGSIVFARTAEAVWLDAG